ncbi:hypothetical protein KC19_3G206000 [Ceratodon purpureus]|uniref:Uncharacterized protein n=1 Tax=Ceratodon purpureus TaxID=3225 RepID=A0A8T0ING6_CERPU|nr:hypothetical protein KC19_3G206000 [Ceratodon purpureus]
MPITCTPQLVSSPQIVQVGRVEELKSSRIMWAPPQNKLTLNFDHHNSKNITNPIASRSRFRAITHIGLRAIYALSTANVHIIAGNASLTKGSSKHEEFLTALGSDFSISMEVENEKHRSS